MSFSTQEIQWELSQVTVRALCKFTPLCLGRMRLHPQTIAGEDLWIQPPVSQRQRFTVTWNQIRTDGGSPFLP